MDINANIVQSVLSACTLGVMGYYGKHIAEEQAAATEETKEEKKAKAKAESKKKDAE